MGVPRGRGSKQEWSCQQQQFSAFSIATSLESLEIRPALLYRNMQSLAGL